MDIYNNKKILVTGGTGLIGRPLVEMLIEKGATVRIASLDDPSRAHPKAEFMQIDLTNLDNCMKSCKDMDYVFNLVGIKGSPKIIQEKPASIFVPMILFNTHMMEAARRCNVKKYLYTSTIGVYSPAEVFYEDDVWKTFPSENDKFGGWAKRMGELQAQAYAIEHNWKDIAIVRPANVYGSHDNFNPENAMVVPSLIKRALEENPFVVWGDGSPIRDFIHAKDVARGMLLALEKCPGPEKPINLGSGIGYSIKELVDTIMNNLEDKPEVQWDASKPSGDKKRIMDVSRAKELLDWEPEISLEQGVKEVMDWYKENKEIVDKRYDVLQTKRKKVLICGATGFIGRNVAEKLAQREDLEVYGTYFNSEPYDNKRINFIKVDLTNKQDIKEVLQGKDIVIQTAAITSGVKDIVSKPYIHVTDNAVMNSLLIREAFEQGVSHFIFPSCTIMYQSSDTPLKESDFDANREMNPKYFGAGWTKVYEEKLCEFFSRLGGTKFTVFRHSNVYGPYDKFDLEKSHVFAATITKVMTAKDKITVWGSGEEERDLLYVSDIVSFIEKAIDKQENAFELVNIGYESSISVRDLVKKIIEISGKNLEIEFDVSKPTIKTKLCLDSTKAKNLFDWKSEVSLDEGIKKTIEWYKENIKW